MYHRLLMIVFIHAIAHAGTPDEKGFSYNVFYQNTYESNILVVKLAMTGKASTLSGSMEKSNVLGSKVENALLKGGIKKQEMTVTKGKSFPSEYSIFGKIKEYESQSDIEIKTKSYSIINSISDILEQEKYLSISSIYFSHDNIDSINAVFTGEAIKKVLESKKIYETNLGLTLKVCSLAELSPSGADKGGYDEYGAYRESMKSYSKRGEAFSGFSTTPKLEAKIGFHVTLCQ